MTPNTIYEGDCYDILRGWPDKCVDLIVTSPPYENARSYSELKFNLSGQDWVDWMFVRIKEMVRVCKGVVAINCEGKTRDYRYSCTPLAEGRLGADHLHYASREARLEREYCLRTHAEVCARGRDEQPQG